MSFKLSYEQLNQPALVESLRVLGSEKLPTKAAWNLSRMIKQIDKALQEGREAYVESVIKANVELDDDGEIVPQLTVEKTDAEGKVVQEAGDPIPGSYIEKEEGAVKKATEEYLQIEVEIESFKLDLDDLAEVKIAAEVLASADPVIMTREEKLDSIKAENVINMKN